MKMKPIALIVFLLGLATQFSTYAAAVKQKDLNFSVKGEELLKGDVHYSVDVLSWKDLHILHPEFFELDTSGFTRGSNATLMVSKTAYVVNKPVGFFDHLKATDVNYLNHILGEQKVTTLGEKTFRVTIPGGTPVTYKLRTHFDSDDISTTANSRAIRAITGAKKMDIQVQGAASIIVKEMWDFSRGSDGAIHVTAYLTLTENKTLVIDYGLMALLPPLLARETLLQSVVDEATAQQRLINSFKEDPTLPQ